MQTVLEEFLITKQGFATFAQVAEVNNAFKFDMKTFMAFAPWYMWEQWWKCLASSGGI